MCFVLKDAVSCAVFLINKTSSLDILNKSIKLVCSEWIVM